MTSTQITPETAPRDLAGLKNQGRFNLRILAQQLGALEQEASKTAFMQQSSDEQAATVLRLLQERDGTAGKTSKGAGGGSPRQPSTKGAAGKTSTPAGGGKAQGEATQGSGGGGTANGAGTALGAGAEKLLAAINTLSTKVDAFHGVLEGLQTQVSQLQGISAGTNRFVALSIGLAGKLAEQTLGASLEQILDIVLEDMPAVEAAMQKMAPADEEEESEDAGGGNDE